MGDGIFVTAFHCVVGKIFLGKHSLELVVLNELEDIVALRGDVKVTGLKLGKMPSIGDTITAVGFPAGFPTVLQIPGVFQGEFQIENFGPPSAIYWGNALPGMSGGPILNTRGEVVGMVTGGGNPSHPLQNIGTGVKFEALRKVIKMAELLK